MTVHIMLVVTERKTDGQTTEKENIGVFECRMLLKCIELNTKLGDRYVYAIDAL